MQMDILRCKTPDMVHKEIWTHLLAYNLLRTIMAVAAHENDIEPRKVSFKGAIPVALASREAVLLFGPYFLYVEPGSWRLQHVFVAFRWYVWGLASWGLEDFFEIAADPPA